MPEALLKIRFVIIGVTVGGLALAVSLRRAGHDVIVLEVADELANDSGINGCTVPPNMSKILLRWGLEKELNDIAVLSSTSNFTHYERGELLGIHTWHEEIFKDAGGSLLCVHYADIRRLLYDKAMSLGARIISSGQILSIDFDGDERPSVTIASGEVFEADVIVGTDKIEGVSRREVIGREIKDIHLGMTVFSVTVPRERMDADPELAPLFEQSTASRAWLGQSRGGLGFVSGARLEYTVILFVPEPGTEELWFQDVSVKQTLAVIGECESRLRKLVELSSRIQCGPLTIPTQPETWIHPSERLILIGDAVHPFPRGSMNELSTSVCDAGALGELFRHLHSMDQIRTFLQAFEDLRRGHVKEMLEADLGTYSVLMMPPGEEHDRRDQAMKEKLEAGIDALAGDEGDDVAEVWERDKAVFAYDAEDHAAEWWNDWGLLQDRAQNQVHMIHNNIPFLEINHIVVPSIDVN